MILWRNTGDRGNERGSALAEAVIALPLTFAMLFAVFALFWAATANAAVRAAARDAARVYAAYTWDDPRYGWQGRNRATGEAVARAQTAMRLAGFRSDRLSVSIRHGAPNPDHVSVDVAYTIDLPFGAGSGILKGVNPTWTLRGHAVARLERQELFR